MSRRPCIASKELAVSHFVKSSTLQNACSTRPRVVVGLGEKCSHAHHRVDEKSPERMMTKALWPCWRRMFGTKMYGNLLSTVTKITRDRGDLTSIVTPIMSWNEDLLDVDHLMHGNWVVHDAAEVYSPEVREHAETNPACDIQEGYCASHQNSRPKSFARIHLPSGTTWP